MWTILRNLRWQWLLLTFGLASCGAAYLLQQLGVPSLGVSSGQVLVTLYVRNSDARVLLRSFVFPNEPGRDHLSFSVAGPGGQADPWLLVIQCPSGNRLGVRHRVPLILQNAPAGPGTEPVLAFAQPPGAEQRQWRLPLGCFAAPPPVRAGAGGAGRLAANGGLSCLVAWRVRFGCGLAASAGQAAGPTSGLTSGQVVNVTLPTLEGDPAGQLKNAATPVYAEESAQGTIRDLVEVYQAPGSRCPAARPGPAASPAARPSRAARPGPAARRSAGPSPAASYPAGCYKPVSPYTTPVSYHLPASVQTTETLENTSLAGDRVDSMFPPGQIKSNDQIFWQGVSGLSPSLSATNLVAEGRDSQYSFFAGVLYGLGLSLIFAFVQIVLTAASGNGGGGPGGPQPGAVARPGAVA